MQPTKSVTIISKEGHMVMAALCSGDAYLKGKHLFFLKFPCLTPLKACLSDTILSCSIFQAQHLMLSTRISRFLIILSLLLSFGTVQGDMPQMSLCSFVIKRTEDNLIRVNRVFSK